MDKQDTRDGTPISNYPLTHVRLLGVNSLPFIHGNKQQTYLFGRNKIAKQGSGG